MFFPVRDENPTLDASVTTLALIGLNVFAWVFVQGLGEEGRLTASVCKLGAIPGVLLGNYDQAAVLADRIGSPCPLDPRADWATVITSMFMHAGWLHLLGNMWFLWVFGDNVEDAMGRARFGVFYVLCGLAAFFSQALADPVSPLPMVGASGAIGGTLGAYARLYPRARVHVLGVFLFFYRRFVVPAAVVLGFWFLLQIISGVPGIGTSATGGVAFWAHAGGFLTGLALAGLFTDPARLELHRLHRLGRHHRSARNLGD